MRPNMKKQQAIKYLESAKTKGFDVKVAGIEKDWNKDESDLTKISKWCKENNVPYLALNTINDYNLEANKLRRTFYPK